MEQSHRIDGTLVLSGKSLGYLTETRKWTTFLSILSHYANKMAFINIS